MEARSSRAESTSLLMICIVSSLFGQDAGSIQGIVMDPQGLAIPSVKITARNTATGALRETLTASDGLYALPNLAVGLYSLTAEASGFKKAIAQSVRLEVAERLRLDFALEVGAVAESIEVTTAPPQLQTSDSQIGAVVENKAIAELPLNGRNFTQLMVLMAGATERAGGTVAGHYNERAGGIAFSVNGHRQTANQFLIDGFMAKEVQHGTNSVEPIIDALQEFRVQTSNYSAEFGTEAGGQINAVLKSGTNSFHGALWEFLRNDKLDANNFFNNRSGTARPAFRRNQYGVAAGGPIIKDRTFIFGAFEDTSV